MQERDVNGDQIGECDCTTNKKNAIKWVKTGTFNKKSEKDKLKTDRDLVQLGELVKTYPEHAKMVLDLISK